jgi:membrane protein DedA with SNARE-associated domain
LRHDLPLQTEAMPPAPAQLPGDIPPEMMAQLSSVDRVLVFRCVSVMSVLGAASMVGIASSLYLLNHHPLVLIALSPLGRHLVLVAPTVDPLAFVSVAVIRRLVFYLASFQMGRALGPVGVDWLENRSPRMGRFIRWLQTMFARASHVVVFFLPGPALSTIAGSAGMHARVFVPIVTLGLIFRMVVMIGIAEWLRVPIEWLLAEIDEYWIPGTVLLVAAMGVHYGYTHRSRRGAG